MSLFKSLLIMYPSSMNLLMKHPLLLISLNIYSEMSFHHQVSIPFLKHLHTLSIPLWALSTCILFLYTPLVIFPPSLTDFIVYPLPLTSHPHHTLIRVVAGVFVFRPVWKLKDVSPACCALYRKTFSIYQHHVALNSWI